VTIAIRLMMTSVRPPVLYPKLAPPAAVITTPPGDFLLRRHRLQPPAFHVRLGAPAHES